MLALILCFVTAVFGQDINAIKVNTTQGTVVGSKASDGNYFQFLGIPYAGNATRFKPAPDPPKFKEEFKADRTKMCAQPTPLGMAGDEDCLTLNVFTKNVNNSRPVIVWIDGESFTRTTNTSHFSFRSLVENEVVVVAVNYRLSIFGFLCLGVEQAPGNVGLKDVIKALQWLQANAAAFGGNPKNVTLLGHGSGAAMVDLITLSPKSENLVHTAIVISGSALAPWAISFNPEGYAKAFAAKFNFTDQSHAKLAEHLTNITVDELAIALEEFEFTNSTLLFSPCVENVQLSESFLDDMPLNLIKAGNYRQIPYAAIYVSAEGTLRVQQAVNKNWLENMKENFEDYLPADLGFKNESVKNIVSKTIWNYYFYAEFKSNTSKVELNNYLRYWGDILVTVPMIRFAKERATVEMETKNSTNIYVMRFDFQNVPESDWNYSNITVNGTKHGAILKYIFDFDTVEVDSKTRNNLINRFVAFARNGVPDAPLESDGDVEWPKFSIDMGYLSFSQADVTEEKKQMQPNGVAVKLWDNLISMYPKTAKRISGDISEPEVITTICYTKKSEPDIATPVILVLCLVLVCIVIYLNRKKVWAFLLPFRAKMTLGKLT